VEKELIKGITPDLSLEIKYSEKSFFELGIKETIFPNFST